MTRFRNRLQSGETATTGILIASLFFLILGARFMLIAAYGNDLPYWDQWGGEGLSVYKPYFDGTLTWSNFLQPHNEHRIVFTRLISLALLLANGQWDARLAMAVNSCIYAFFGCLLYLLYRKYLGGWARITWWCAIAVVFSLPFGWENTITGFQSQVYLMIAFSLATIWFLGNYQGWSWRWGAGCAIGFTSLFTMASGLLASLAVLALLCLRLLRGWQKKSSILRLALPTVVICIVIVATGAMLAVEVPMHAAFRARNISHFTTTLDQILGWPGLFFPGWGFANWLPFCALAAGFLRRRIDDAPIERFTIGAGIWVLLQIAATAAARAVLSLSSRYLDLFSIGFLVNLACLYLLLRQTRSAAQKTTLAVCFALWLAMNGYGYYKATQAAMVEAIPVREAAYRSETFRTSGFLGTGDRSFFTTDVQYVDDVPYHDVEKLIALLHDPAIRRRLPVSVRDPLKMSGENSRPYGADASSGLEPPFPWQKAWTFSGNTGASTVYTAAKDPQLPFIFMYISGNSGRLYVTDAKQCRHRLVPLAPENQRGWQPAYALCPGPTCRITTVTTTGDSAPPPAFSEPAEMGVLSLAALLAVGHGQYLIAAGGGLLLLAVLLANLRRLRKRA